MHLPADGAAHRVPNEWWYLVGHLRSGGRTFGYETTIFKFVNIRAPGQAAPVSIYRTDVAITDERARRFQQQVTYLFPQSAAASSRRLDVRAGSVRLTATTGGAMHLRSAFRGGSIDLTLRSRRAPMYVGGRGYLPFGNGYTYYYSLTDLASRGRLIVGGRSFPVSGVSWLDHQWGRWSWSAIRGWTWMALQLDNGAQLSVFDFRSTGNRQRAASVAGAGGRTRTLRDIAIRPAGTWRSRRTGGVYPASWTVTIPGLRARLHVRPTVPDQELVVPGPKRGSYWEGSALVSGTYAGKRVRGQAYVELTGYAGR